MHPEDKAKFWHRWWRIEHLYWIQTKKAGAKIRFKLKPAQERIKRYLMYWNWILVLKARQVGISTFFLIYHLDRTLFTPNCNTCILAHKRESLVKLFRIIKIAYDSCPESFQLADGTIWRKPKAKYDTKNELYFEGIDSRIYVALEVRSDTLHGLHISELDHIKNADDVLTATMGALAEGAIVTAETTANGVGGPCYQEWENDSSQFLKAFIGYQDDPDYCDEVENPAAFKKTLTEEEQKLLNVENMKLGNIAWRRRQLSVAARRKKFKQEFPCTAQEAFITTGKSPFDREQIMDWIIRDPIETRMEGRLQYWFKPIKGRRYLVSVDCASGMGDEIDKGNEPEGGTDWSVIGVWDCETWQKVAMFRAKWPYSKLHQVVHQLGTEFNNAYVVIEATDHGLTVINNLVEHVNMDCAPYPREMIHTTQVLDKKTKQNVTKWGWYTNLKTKPLIIDRLAEAIDEHEIKIYSRKAQSEFLKFIIDDKGKYRAMDGYKDDIVMESAIAIYNIPNALRAGRMTATKEELGLSDM